jgi:hypothetical protein
VLRVRCFHEFVPEPSCKSTRTFERVEVRESLSNQTHTASTSSLSKQTPAPIQRTRTDSIAVNWSMHPVYFDLQ